MNDEISGIVVRGDGYGRKIGFPTVNLKTENKLPKDGVYAGTGIIDDKEFRAGIVIGPNGKVEAHLIEFAGDAYGREVKLKIKKFLRDYKKFEKEKDLKEQIKKDLEQC